MKVIFLDYDGVVNTPVVNGVKTPMLYPSHKKVNNFYAVQLLSYLCETNHCEIAVISSWRTEPDYADCLYNSGLSRKINIIDFMPGTLDKTELIKEFLNTYTVDKYIVIDDFHIHGIAGEKFIKCDYNTGFGIEEYEKAIKILK